MTVILEIALNYKRRGWQPIPIAHRSKNPNFSGWQNFSVTENELPNHFNGKPQNIGVLLGAKSNGLIDIDLDSPEAIKIANYFLPETKAVFGRASKPRSHRLYYCKDANFEKFNNPFFVSSKDEAERKKACIVELRTGDGKQTVFPGSTHETGEEIGWHDEGEPFRVDARNLRRAVALLASACLISTLWREGFRNELNLALSGALLRRGFEVSETKNFIRAVGAAASDEEITDRMKAIDATAEKLKRGENVFGLPKLAELTDKKLVETVCKWLEIKKPGDNAENDSNAEKTQTNGKATFHFATLDELLSEPEEEHAYIWENTLISGGFSICSAKPKVGKSTVARNLAVAITKGETFLGRETIRGKVIYLCLEEKRSEVAKHFRAMGACGEDIFIHTGKTPENALRALEVAIAEIEPVLVIIDPLARVLRVNDFNDYGTMTRGLEPFIDLARKTNVHINALHHEGKGEREGGDAILGSTAIFGAVDCQIQLRKRNNGRTVSTTQRYGVDLPETVIDLDKETGVISDKGDLQTFVLHEKKTEIFNSITDTEKLSETEIKERVGGNSKGIISKAIRQLYEERFLNRAGDGKKGNPFLYFKNLENLENPQNLETPGNDFTENEKPRNEADKQRAKSEQSVSRFLGFSNSENPENLQNPETKNEPIADGQKTEFYACPKCSTEIPMAEDVCQSCGKRAIEF